MSRRKAKANAFLAVSRPPKSRSANARAEAVKEIQDLPPFIIRGQVADSKDEYWVSLALTEIEENTGWKWRYQVPVEGGSRLRGGNILDFVVYTPGMSTILEPMGRPWHTGVREDRFQMEDVARRMGYRLLAWFTDDPAWNTRDKVRASLFRELHV